MKPPNELVDEIKNNNCVVFVGAGLSQGAGLPGWKGLLSQMMDWAEKHDVDVSDRAELESYMERNELLIVAAEMRGRMKERFHEFMLETFYDANLEPTEAHKLIPSIPFAAVLTSNYDKLLEDTYKKVPLVFTHADSTELSNAFKSRRLYILKVHGTIDRIDTVILGVKDYRPLLNKNSAYHDYMKILFTIKTILFLGFSFTDPDPMRFLDELDVIFKGNTRRHYALMSDDAAQLVRRKHLEDDYRIQVISYEKTSDDHPEVREFLQKLAESCGTLPGPIKDKSIIAPRFIYQDLNGNGQWDPGEPYYWELPDPMDKSGMVLIPAGEFQMGDDEFDDAPVHKVYLDAFYIDKYEVTNAQYRRFVKKTGSKEPEGYIHVDGKWQYGFKPWQDKNFNGDDQPVVCVSWEDAKAYANWSGKRLPTEAEWEKAARGDIVGKKYVWDDRWPPPEGVGNFADEALKKIEKNWLIIDEYNDGYAYTSPVGKFKPNGYGLYDMAGNVWEWCADWYSEDYYKNSPKENPKGPDIGVDRVLRGGSWYYNSNKDLRVAYRILNKPKYSYRDAGFRCCAGL